MKRREFLRTAALISGASYRPLRALLPAVAPSPIIRTTAGPVRGRMADGIASFRGIPYGADTRTRRFRPPVPPAPWTAVRDCFAWAPKAPQIPGARGGTRAPQESREPGSFYALTPDEGGESEDCLHLNVWTPSPTTRGHEKRPVLFYIHGGAYNNGTANAAVYDGTRLAKRGDAVVITVNHRLNAFGFLYLAGITNDPAYADSGNVGMLDLVLALQWVRDNIAAFGGDPTRVTIWGQSGGGAKCATLMAMPAAHGLFHRVMTMSGQQVKGASTEIATTRTREYLAELGLEKTPPDKLHAALDALPFERLQQASRVSGLWLPVVDDTVLPRDPFTPDAPPLSAGVPMILGNVHDETRSLIGAGNSKLWSLTWEELPGALQKAVGSFLGPYTAEDVVKHYREWYPQYTPADVFFSATTAFRSWAGQRIEAEERASDPASAKHTWVYEADWPSPVAGGKFRAPHTIDIPFYFDNLAVSPNVVGATPEQVRAAQPLADAMSETLLAFARTGDPNNPHIPRWPTYDLNQRATMIWDTPPHVVDDPRGKERVYASAAHYHQAGT